MLSCINRYFNSNLIYNNAEMCVFQVAKESSCIDYYICVNSQYEDETANNKKLSHLDNLKKYIKTTTTL